MRVEQDKGADPRRYLDLHTLYVGKPYFCTEKRGRLFHRVALCSMDQLVRLKKKIAKVKSSSQNKKKSVSPSRNKDRKKRKEKEPAAVDDDKTKKKLAEDGAKKAMEETAKRLKEPENTIPDIDERIHSTAHSGTVLELTALLKMTRWRPNFVKPGWDGTTALHMACFRSDPEMTKILLKHGWSANSKDHKEETPMHWVCKHNGRADLPEARRKRKVQIKSLNKLKVDYKKLQEQQAWSLSSVQQQREKRIRFAEERAEIKQRQSWKFRLERALGELSRTSKYYVAPSVENSNHAKEQKMPKGIGKKQIKKMKSSDLASSSSEDELLDGEVELDTNEWTQSDYVHKNTEDSTATDTAHHGALAANDDEGAKESSVGWFEFAQDIRDRIMDQVFLREATNRLKKHYEEMQRQKIHESLAQLRIDVDAEITKQMTDQADVFKTRSREMKMSIKLARNQIKQEEETAVNYSMLSIRALLDGGGNLHEPGAMKVTPLQYAEMYGKMEIAKFIRFESKRIDRMMGKETDIGRWKRLEAMKNQYQKAALEKRRILEEKRREREAKAEEKLKEQIAMIETEYDPVVGNKLATSISEKDAAKAAKALMPGPERRRSLVTGLELPDVVKRGGQIVVMSKKTKQ
jgi:ankyrin repeat protein